MSHRTKIWILLLVSIILFCILFYYLPDADRSYINVLGLIGFLLSIVGVVIAYLQILSIKEIAEQTKSEVLSSLKLNNNLLMLSDLSRKVAMIDDIQNFIKDDKIELCILRMKDLKIILNALKNQDFYNGMFSKKEFKTVFQDFNIDLDNFQQHHLNNKSRLDKAKIITNLESLSTLLLDVEIKIKNIGHDN